MHRVSEEELTKNKQSNLCAIDMEKKSDKSTGLL